MQPMLSGEMGAARAAEMRERAAHSRMVKQAKAARRQEDARTHRVVGILPWRSVARGRAVGKVRARTSPECC